MARYKTVSYNELIIQGLQIEKKLAEIEESKEDEIQTIKKSPLYCTSIFDDIFYESMKTLLVLNLEQDNAIPVISKLEYVGEIGNMQNVIREETTTGIIRYYSYIDQNNYFMLNEADAIENKVAQWKQLIGNITKVYEQFQKHGVNTIPSESEQIQKLYLKR